MTSKCQILLNWHLEMPDGNPVPGYNYETMSM